MFLSFIPFIGYTKILITVQDHFVDLQNTTAKTTYLSSLRVSPITPISFTKIKQRKWSVGSQGLCFLCSFMLFFMFFMFVMFIFCFFIYLSMFFIQLFGVKYNPAKSARHLGVLFDKHFTFCSHILAAAVHVSTISAICDIFANTLIWICTISCKCCRKSNLFIFTLCWPHHSNHNNQTMKWYVGSQGQDQHRRNEHFAHVPLLF